MLDWIKRAWRGFTGGWLSPRLAGPTVTNTSYEILATSAAYLEGVMLAQAAQKNLRLHSIARERNRLKDEIARLKRSKKRHSHLLAELGRLTRLELELESGK